MLDKGGEGERIVNPREALGTGAAFALLLTHSARGQASLDDLNAFLGANVYPAGLSADGSVLVGTVTTSPSGSRAFRYTQSGGLIELEQPDGADGSSAKAVSADGTTVVGDLYIQGAVLPFKWTVGSGMVVIGLLPGAIGGEANAVSGDGSIVVGLCNIPPYSEAFRWSVSDGMVGLGYLAGDLASTAVGVSGDGLVVAGTSENMPDGSQAFVWTQAGGLTGLGHPAGNPVTEAYGISPDGTVVVGRYCCQRTGFDGFMWTAAGGLQLIPRASSVSGYPAWAVASGGAVVVGEPWAYRWDAEHGPEPLSCVLGRFGISTAGWTFSTATAISADGRVIVGVGTSPTGGTSWRATIPLLRPCYANCDQSSVAPVLNANDFQCFLNRYAGDDEYADCDCSTVQPVLNANDFQCFLNAFAAGCS
jgi:uncharacterized membrane protein